MNKIIGWATVSETAETGYMFWPTREEAQTYCEDWERPIALVAQPAQQPLDLIDISDRLVAASAAVADQDDRAAQAILSETLSLLAGHKITEGTP